MLPTAADLLAYHLWTIPRVGLEDMIKRGMPTLTKEELRDYQRFTSPASITDVMAVALQDGAGPAPGLEHIWRTKGIDANRGDLSKYWGDTRLLELKTETVEPTALSVASEDTKAILAKLEELKVILQSIETHSIAGSDVSVRSSETERASDASTLAFVQAALDLVKTK